MAEQEHKGDAPAAPPAPPARQAVDIQVDDRARLQAVAVHQIMAIGGSGPGTLFGKTVYATYGALLMQSASASRAMDLTLTMSSSQTSPT